MRKYIGTRPNLPEDEEDQQVERQEDAQHACFQEEEEHHVGFDAVGDAEGGQDGQRREQRGQQNHRQRDAIHAEVEGGIDGLVPDDIVLRTGNLASRAVEAEPQATSVSTNGIRLAPNANQRISLLVHRGQEQHDQRRQRRG